MRKKRIDNSEMIMVMRWFRRAVTCDGKAYTIDAEQAAAVISDDLNAIVVARAGSGKTRTIVAKMVYLIAKCGVRAEEMMVFVFNANAAREINERLSNMRVDGESVVNGNTSVARTFHAFARKMVYEASGGKEKCGKILAGEKGDYVFTILTKLLKEEKWMRKVKLFLKGESGASESGIEETELMYLAKLIALFINRAQQKYLGGKVKIGQVARKYLRLKCDLSNNKKESNDVNMREKLFVELGIECFRRYHWHLLEVGLSGYEEYGTDFNLLVSWASKLIVGGRDGVQEWLAGKKYILIDEYQDFSQLFLAVVLAVRQVVPEVRLFVVGDDWQAINRFAGSEVEYFKEFEHYFPVRCRRYEITTNYRCDYEVVETAKRFMRKALSERGEFRAKSRRAGRVMLVDVRRTKTMYLEVLVRLLRENRKAKEILLLHRNNETNLKISLVGLKLALKQEVVRVGVMSVEEFDAKVKVMTMHRSKGLEAEVVIILEADEGVIPKIHPDTALYGVFGESEDVSFGDQVRLFYVAMTRAKKRLYILHDFSAGIGFVKYLGIGMEKWEE